MAFRLRRDAYAALYGPTTKDRVRLADTDLIIEVEKDFTTYGEELKLGEGCVIRDGMGQSQVTYKKGAVDTVITNALILDYWGVVKADIGIKDGRIDTIGKAGNPDIQSNIDIIIGPGTAIIPAEGRLITAGAVETHTSFSMPQQIWEALYAGVTTMLGGGVGPTEGRNITGCTPGPWHIGRMLQAAEALPLNIGFFGKGNASKVDALREQVMAGACALKLHPHWGSTPSAIDTCLSLAELVDVQVSLNTDGLNEFGNSTDTQEVIRDRTLNVLHSSDRDFSEVIGFLEKPNVLLSSSFGFVEDVLHDMGVLPMITSNNQVSGAGGFITRTWQTAHRMKVQRGRLKEEIGDNDNLRVRRYLAKYTVNPAIAYGLGQHVGSVEVGKLADLVLWHPILFGVRPDLVLKGGIVAAASTGASGVLSTPALIATQLTDTRPMFGSCGLARTLSTITFVSRQAIEESVAKTLGLKKLLVSVWGACTVTRKDMLLNNTVQQVKVTQDLERVWVNDELLPRKPQLLSSLPLAQRYSLF